MTPARNNINDFPENQLDKFRIEANRDVFNLLRHTGMIVLGKEVTV